MKRLITIFMISVILVNLTACTKKEPEEKRYEAQFLELFDTVTTIVGYAQTKEKFTDDAQMIYDQLKEYHELFDIYNDYDGVNNIKTINDNAGKKPVKVDQKIIEMLKFAKEEDVKTNGKMNVAFGSVLAVWHEYREEGIENPEEAKLPPMDVLQEKNQHIDINQMIIDETASTVFLKDPQMRLDVGAVAKGYATEMVSRYAEEHGFKRGMISVGGNVRTIGSKDDKGTLWNVGIQNPDMESDQSNLFVLGLKEYSLVTSGDYQRYYTVNGKIYHHIIDPVTLLPADYFRSVSIVCKSSALADAYSTAVFNMPFEDGYKFVEDQPDVEALWVFKNGDMKFSSHFEELISKK